MRAKTKNPLSALMTRCKSSLHRVVGSSRTWLGNHQARIWLAISTATFAVAMILPRGWVRGRGDLIQVNLIDFLLRGVVVPEALFFAALVGSRFVRLK